MQFLCGFFLPRLVCDPQVVRNWPRVLAASSALNAFLSSHMNATSSVSGLIRSGHVPFTMFYYWAALNSFAFEIYALNSLFLVLRVFSYVLRLIQAAVEHGDQAGFLEHADSLRVVRKRLWTYRIISGIIMGLAIFNLPMDVYMDFARAQDSVQPDFSNPESILNGPDLLIALNQAEFNHRLDIRFIAFLIGMVTVRVLGCASGLLYFWVLPPLDAAYIGQCASIITSGSGSRCAVIFPSPYIRPGVVINSRRNNSGNASSSMLSLASQSGVAQTTTANSPPSPSSKSAASTGARSQTIAAQCDQVVVSECVDADIDTVGDSGLADCERERKISDLHGELH